MKALVAILAVVVLLVFAWAGQEHREPSPPPFPEKYVQIGTNEPPRGCNLFTSHTRIYYGQVGGSDAAYHFPDGEVAPAVLIQRDTMRVWIRRRHLNSSIIAAR